MRLDVHIHVHGQHDDPLRRIEAALAGLTQLVNQVLTKEAQQMAKIDDVMAKVAEQTTVIASVGVFIEGLRQQIADGATPAQLDAALAALQGNNDQLSGFISNTPAVTPGATEALPV